MKIKKILFLGAHPDDEFGCSGALSRFREEKKEIYFAVFSFCEESVPPGFPKDVLKGELKNALRVIGIESRNIFKFNFPVRNFHQHRQDILEELIKIRNRVNPDLVLVPALSDIHQDHHVVAMEGLRAFKNSSIFGYELPMNTISFQHACFISLKEKHIKRKVESLKCYESQGHRPYSNAEFIRGLARVRGVQIGETFAEAFEVIRLKL